MSREPVVYVVDDDPAVLRSSAALIKVVFPHVATFESATEFLETFDPEQPGCLVLDVALPGMSGLELQRKFIADRIDLPIIFITGHANVQMAVDAMQSGAVNFLEKPFREQDLWGSIRKALDQGERRRRQKIRRGKVESQLGKLSRGEREVLELILEGKLNKEIAQQLDLSIRTVEDRRAKLMKKMQARSVAELVRMAMVR